MASPRMPSLLVCSLVILAAGLIWWLLAGARPGALGPTLAGQAAPPSARQARTTEDLGLPSGEARHEPAAAPLTPVAPGSTAPQPSAREAIDTRGSIELRFLDALSLAPLVRIPITLETFSPQGSSPWLDWMIPASHVAQQLEAAGIEPGPAERVTRRTNKFGGVQFSQLAGRGYRVYVGDPTLMITSPTEVRLNEAGRLESKDVLFVRATVSIHGQLVESDSGAPLSGVPVRTVHATHWLFGSDPGVSFDLNDPSNLEETRTDSSGHFRLRGLLPEREYELILGGQEQRMRTELVTTGALGESLDVGAIDLGSGLEVTLELLDGAGAPMAAQPLMPVQKQADGKRWDESVLAFLRMPAATDSSGRSRCANLTPGEWFVITPVVVGGKLIEEQLGRFILVEGDRPRTIQLTLSGAPR